MGISHGAHAAFIEKCVEHGAQQHLKGGRRADPGCAYDIAGNICVEASHAVAGILKSLEKALYQVHGSRFFLAGFQMVQINGKILVICLADNMYLVGFILSGHAHTVQVNAACQHLAVVVICMIAADFRPARRGEQHHIPFPAKHLLISCQQILIALYIGLYPVFPVEPRHKSPGAVTLQQLYRLVYLHDLPLLSLLKLLNSVYHTRGRNNNTIFSCLYTFF